MLVPTASSPLRTAHAGDAPVIYALKRQAFGASYLLYTIYQAPQSVSYLAKIIAEGEQGGGHDFIVSEHDGEVTGYYHAVRHDAQYFLNYIATADESRSRGLGNILLQHFEANGIAKNCHELALDVFESNPTALNWYGRHDYKPIASSFHVRLDMNALAGGGAPLLWDEQAWSQALADERTWGFSKIQCHCASGQLTVGLIAGHSCKLIAYQGVSLHEALSAIALNLKNWRQVVIMSSLPDLPADLPILSAEKAIRLSKSLL